MAAFAKLTGAERVKEIDGRIQIVGKKTDEEIKAIKNITPMSFWEEAAAMLCFALGVPGSVLTLPMIFALVGYVTGYGILKTMLCGFLLLAPLAVIPLKFKEANLYSWISVQIIRYFSFKVIFDDYVPESTPSILVAPPHGVFPFGNIATMLAFPSLMGYSFSGIGSSAIFMTPVFKQMLEWIGTVDANRETCKKILSDGRRNPVIGVSTGGVAEVFETDSNDNDEGEECVVLMNRKGICKLALQTGANMVPCYLFGNSKLLSIYYGGPLRDKARWLSRKVGFALVFFWGRLFLPIPYRVPILGVLSKPIKVQKTENPSQKQIDDLHAELIIRMTELFDKHKHLYGWSKKTLVIK